MVRHGRAEIFALPIVGFTAPVRRIADTPARRVAPLPCRPFAGSPLRRVAASAFSRVASNERPRTNGSARQSASLIIGPDQRGSLRKNVGDSGASPHQLSAASLFRPIVRFRLGKCNCFFLQSSKGGT
jgi:hypothetical protein